MQQVDPKFVDYAFLRFGAAVFPLSLIMLLMGAGFIVVAFIMFNVTFNLTEIEQELGQITGGTENAAPIPPREAVTTFFNIAADNVDLPQGFFLAFGIVAALFLILPLILLWIWAKLTYRYLQYELGKDEFREEFGILWKHSVSIPYHRIQNLQIRRDLFSRLLGLSMIEIQTAGSSMPEARLYGLSRKTAENIREELLKRSRRAKR